MKPFASSIETNEVDSKINMNLTKYLGIPGATREVDPLTPKEGREFVDRKDEWIFDATCIHLAAQYCPKSLQLILSSVENKKEMIKQVHPKKEGNYTITPLHISAKKVDPISTKYLLLKKISKRFE